MSDSRRPACIQLAIAFSLCACGPGMPSSDGSAPSGDSGGSVDAEHDGAAPDAVTHDAPHGDSTMQTDSAGGGVDAHSPRDAAPGNDAATAPVDAVPVDAAPPPSDAGGSPSGWLYTNGNAIYVSQGAGSGTPWMGRGVNIDDMFFCGYNSTLWMSSPDATIETMASNLIADWHPNFIRISLSMASDTPHTSWLTNASQYKTPMTNIINSIGSHAGVYVLVTLRSDDSMIGQDQGSGDAEATGVPSDSHTTPNAAMYPTGTDAVYTALVDSFANDSYVLFGLTNEPGGNTQSNATLAAAMSHAVSVIRAEEDHLGVPHHIVSVQGNNWTSEIGFYSTSPLPYDNVVYEVHGYPPAANSYTFNNIPVIIGEYGSLNNSAAFYADVESKHISNLAWDFDPYNNCAPDLVNQNQTDMNFSPTSWGQTVQAYLAAH